MNCKKCGKKLKKGVTICPSCGTKNYENAGGNSSVPQKKISKNTLIIIISAVILVIAAVVAAIVISNGKTDEDSDSKKDKNVSKTEFVTTVDTSMVTTIPFNEEILDKIENEENESTQNNAHYFVKFTMENGESFVVGLYPEYAPKTVENFLKLVNSGFYNGLTFHRVIEDFMAQGGDPKGDGTGGSSKTIYGEFAANGFTQNTLSHERGVISMARSAYPDSASSQFFICYASAPHLDGSYAAFGKVVEGMNVVDSFLDVERAYVSSDRTFSKPIEPIVIKTATQIEY